MPKQAQVQVSSGQGQAAFYQDEQQPSAHTDTGLLGILSQLDIDPLAALVSGLLGHTSAKSFVDDSGLGMVLADAPSTGSTTPSAITSPPDSIPDRPPLINFENNVPPRRLSPSSNSALEETTIELLSHSFANSYGKPARTTYSLSLLPPSYRDPSKWTSLSLDQVGRARGRQFDRLGSVFLDGVEIVRTDNAEPVNTTGGVIWTTRKDVSKYWTLFSRSNDSEVVFQYPNIVDKTYTSPLNLTLSLTVQQLKSDHDTAGSESSHHDCPAPPTLLADRTPDAIYGISKSGPDLFNVPEDSASVSFTIPRNSVKALLEVYASGTAADEFWYTGINDDLLTKTINGSNVTTPHGPYREIQVLIDDQVAGITAPYPVIFTGGLNPLLWRPQTSYGSYDQPTYLFDVTPFLGVMSDGNPHTYGIRVVSAEESGKIPKGWFVSANLQLVLSKDSQGVTKGDKPIVQGPQGDFDLSGHVISPNFTADNGALTSDVKTRRPRKLTVVGRISTPGNDSTTNSSSSSEQIRVVHTISYSSQQAVKNSGGDSVQTSHTTGQQRSTHGKVDFLRTDYSFPLSTHIASKNVSLNASVRSAYKSKVVFGTHLDLDLDTTTNCKGPSDASTFGLPQSSSYDVKQDAQASTAIKDGKLAGGLGGNNSTIKYLDSQGFTYERTLHTYNYTVTRDEVSGTLKDLAPPVQ